MSIAFRTILRRPQLLPAVYTSIAPFTALPNMPRPKRAASSSSASSTGGAGPSQNGGLTNGHGQNGKSAKKAKTTKTARTANSSSSSSSTNPLTQPHPQSSVGEQNGVILRQYYPAEMSTARAQAYADGELTTPMQALDAAIEETASEMARVGAPSGKSPVVHYFKSDLRVHDNRALHQAAELASENGVPLVGLYVVSPQDWEAHNTAPVRVDLVLRTLEVLKKDLAKLNIPLWIETVDDRRQVPRRILDKMDEWGSKHLFANLEYEPDELRRETRLLRLGASEGKSVTVVHDSCVVPPGQLISGSGRTYAVYTPWFRAFKQYIHDHEDVIDLVDAPDKVADKIRKDLPKALFECSIPAAPEGKKLESDEEATRFRELWPAGEAEATSRLERFCEDRMRDYSRNRDIPSAGATSAISPYLATGTISARTVVHTASDRANASSLDGGSDGFRVWVSEVAWRDFYKNVMVGWPHIAMNKPFKPAYSNLEWAVDDDDAKFEAWTAGRTGYPFVDAAMRQLLHEGWMHNRSRMVVASFLSKDLLLDWRRGEQWFMRHLVDGDVASNIGGWGFSASVGVDPQPYFRVFNPYRQSERFDPEGVYIRQWVPELRNIESNTAIHEPHGKGAREKAREAGYPEPIVDHKQARDAALSAYKRALGRE